MPTLSLVLLLTLLLYFALLLVTARLSGGGRGNEAFFRGRRASPWWMVGFGMIGASLSGVSLVSVPGWVQTTGMTYLQMCLGFAVGYLVVAFVLLPLYYRLRLTSIYAYLRLRFGRRTHRTGAVLFVVSKLTGAAARLYLACLVLLQFLPLPRTGAAGTAALLGVAAVVLLLIWLYTRRGGIYTIVRTDALQTLCLLLALGCLLWIAGSRAGLSFSEAVAAVRDSPMSTLWCFEAGSRQYFWRQFLSGIFVVVVMTGLDQDMMQKNLTCRTLREAQKNMCAYGACFFPVNLLLLALGVLLYTVAEGAGLSASAHGDALLPTLVAHGTLGAWVAVPLAIGVVAAAFSSADSALAALTTSVCVDLLDLERTPGRTAQQNERTRRRVHLALACAFLVCIVGFRAVGSTSVIDAIYVMASYTYGPLLGLYAFGLYTRRAVREGFVPVAAVGAPLLCAVLAWGAPRWWGYTPGYELLMVNGTLTFLLLLAASRRATSA